MGFVSISSFRAGDEVRGVFACVRKDRLKTRTGSPYLALELRDKTGSVQARAFRDADVLAGLFERGDLVSVVGRVERFRDQLTVEISDIRRAEGRFAGTGEDATLADRSEAQTVMIQEFLPVAYRDMEELDGFLEHLSREVYDPGYRALLESLLDDAEIRQALRRTPCTRNGHHAYLGGLLEHTVAVATLAREICDLHRRLDSDLLITAAIVHDLGRIREFTYGAEIGLSDEGRLLGHLVLGQQLLSERFALLEQQGTALDQSHRLALLHCVLSHHGASSAPGGRFASPEALALYRVNALDAGVKGVLEHGFQGGEEGR
ncbi:MAG TPA: HD domain-containing protein [Solirubrobacteraceae bacterium]|nr:HD domain-containing protein [Solirubrobacteraceae bacterium]